MLKWKDSALEWGQCSEEGIVLSNNSLTAKHTDDEDWHYVLSKQTFSRGQHTFSLRIDSYSTNMLGVTSSVPTRDDSHNHADSKCLYSANNTLYPEGRSTGVLLPTPMYATGDVVDVELNLGEGGGTACYFEVRNRTKGWTYRFPELPRGKTWYLHVVFLDADQITIVS